MLKLILGRAKSGRTAAVMDDIARLVRAGRAGTVLLVPEQYSHEAEAELLRVCGDSLSLYAEVLSFKRLAMRVLSERPSAARPALDAGGRLLCMALAVESVYSRLRVYGTARSQPELQRSLLDAVDAMKSAGIPPDALLDAAQTRAGLLGGKLHDLALVCEAYDAVTARTELDPADRLTLLARELGSTPYASGTFFLDGFTDFTRQECEVVRSLLRSGADVTVCLTCAGLEDGREIFEPSRRAALLLRRIAEREGVQCSVFVREKRAPETATAFLEENLFSFSEKKSDACGAADVVCAASISDECECAAAHCLELVRETGCRWRDIAVAVRGYEDYRPALENAFARFGVPVYSAGMSNVAAKPLTALITGAFEIIGGGWALEDVCAYIKTGLVGLLPDECLELEDYAYLWTAHGSMWYRGAWRQHPDGFGAEATEESTQRLAHINALRERVCAPLRQLEERGKSAVTAAQQADALARLWSDIGLAEALALRARRLDELGLSREAAEYAQLWEIAVSALEQCAAVLGDMPMDQARFGRLFGLMLSRYDVGTIPLSLDRVLCGDMDRMRRRHIKHLLVLGCDSSRVPLISQAGGIFSDDDLDELEKLGVSPGGGAEDRLCHEFALIYGTFTLPSDSVYVSWCAMGADGAAQPSFAAQRIARMFSLAVKTPDMDDVRSNAAAPALGLASGEARSAYAMAAREYFEKTGRGGELEELGRRALPSERRLSRAGAGLVYGPRLRLSASRIDKYASCRFSYFMQYGLRARPRKPTGFSPPELGSYMHYILQRTADEISSGEGFEAMTPERAAQLCEKYSDLYVREHLGGFEGRTRRFEYLFRRLESSVRSVVTDMAEELAVSSFRPLDFELDFGDGEQFRPIALGSGEDRLYLTGIADRVDGWMHDGRLYLRVVDYKTGRKKFSLSDAWHGLGLQMLLYLFALGREGGRRYGGAVVPAGVLYVPARDELVRADGDMTDGEIAAEKSRARRRSGLILDDGAVIEAMEPGDEKRFLPPGVLGGRGAAESLASEQGLQMLQRHVERLLREMAADMRAGDIAANPYSRSEQDSACAVCEFAPACRFDERRDCRRSLPRLRGEEVWKMLEEEEGK